jgi:hypothetical protein
MELSKTVALTALLFIVVLIFTSAISFSAETEEPLPSPRPAAAEGASAPAAVRGPEQRPGAGGGPVGRAVEPQGSKAGMDSKRNTVPTMTSGKDSRREA